MAQIKRNSNMHSWTPKERKLILKNLEKTPATIKQELFAEDDSITIKAIGMQQYNLRNGKMTVDGYVPGVLRKDKKRRYTKSKAKTEVKETVSKVKNPAQVDPIKQIYTEFLSHNKVVKSFSKEMVEHASKSPFPRWLQAKMVKSILDISDEAMKAKSNELLSQNNKEQA